MSPLTRSARRRSVLGPHLWSAARGRLWSLGTDNGGSTEGRAGLRRAVAHGAHWLRQLRRRRLLSESGSVPRGARTETRRYLESLPSLSSAAAARPEPTGFGLLDVGAGATVRHGPHMRRLDGPFSAVGVVRSERKPHAMNDRYDPDSLVLSTVLYAVVADEKLAIGRSWKFGNDTSAQRKCRQPLACCQDAFDHSLRGAGRIARDEVV